MIYDCFPFFNELDLLEIRMEELSPIVDQFVLIESPMTHSGLDKPFYFEENRARFAKWIPKIRRLVVDPIIGHGKNWQREHQQRDTILAGIEDAKDDDLVIVSDADEIFSSESLERSALFCLGMNKFKPVHIQQRTCYYYFNRRWRLDSFSSVIGAANNFRLVSPTDCRFGRIFRDEVVQDGGWHFTYMGGQRSVLQKMKAFAHAGEQTNSTVIERIESGLAPEIEGASKVYPIPIDQSFPKAIYEHQQKWIDRGFIKP